MSEGSDISVLYREFADALTEVLAENAVGPARRGRLARARATVRRARRSKTCQLEFNSFGQRKAELDGKLDLPHWTLHDLRHTARPKGPHICS
jgi:hypothetical protein